MIEDREYPLRKLGLVDIGRLTRIVKKASQFIDRSIIENIDSFTPKMAGSFLIDYLPDAFDEIVAFLATVISLEPGVPEDVVKQKRKKSKAKEFVDPNEGTIRDPNVFPLDALPDLIAKLTEHRNVVDFFANSGAMVAGLKKLFGGSDESSTESSDDTDGPTNTSPEDD